jgi:hypothetical protein
MVGLSVRHVILEADRSIDLFEQWFPLNLFDSSSELRIAAKLGELLFKCDMHELLEVHAEGMSDSGSLFDRLI